MARDVYVIGSVNLDLVVRAETLPWAGRDGDGRDVRAPRRRQERQPGGGRGAPRRGGADDRRGRRRRARRGGGRRSSRPRASTSARCSGSPRRPTGVALIAVDAKGENQIAVASGANAELSPEAVEAALAGAASGGVALIGLEVPDAAVLAGARAARAAGLQVVLNPAPGAAAERRAARPLPRADAQRRRGLRDQRRGRPGGGRAGAQRAHPRAGRRDGRRRRRAAGRGRRASSASPPRASRSSTPPARATRSTARSPPSWPAARRSRTPCARRWRSRPSRCVGPAHVGSAEV